MNQSAEKHLAKAETYIGKGEAWYRKAAEEILAAKKADSTLSNREIGERFDRSERWVREIVTWVTTSEPGSKSPNWARLRGSHGTKAEIEAGVKKLLSEAPMELVERVLDDLPASRIREIGAVTGNEHLARLTKISDNTRRPVTEGISGMFVPSIVDEKRALIKKLREVGAYLDKHGDKMIPDPDGEVPAESLRDLTLGGFASDKGEIDLAFAELGIGTSIEAGFGDLLSES